MKIIIILLLSFIYLFANDKKYIDSDLDGVIDIYDKCLNTSFEDEVDKYGCSKNDNNFSKIISFSFERNYKNADSYKYAYDVNKLAFYLGNNTYHFGVSQTYLNLDYTYKNEDFSLTNYGLSGYGNTSFEFGYLFKEKFLESLTFKSEINTSKNEYLTLDENIYSIKANWKNNLKYFDLNYSLTYNFIENSSYNNYFDYQIGVIKNINNIFYALDFYYNEPILNDIDSNLSIQPSIYIPILSNYQLGFSYSTNFIDENSFTFKLSYCF